MADSTDSKPCERSLLCSIINPSKDEQRAYGKWWTNPSGMSFPLFLFHSWGVSGRGEQIVRGRI